MLKRNQKKLLSITWFIIGILLVITLFAIITNKWAGKAEATFHRDWSNWSSWGKWSECKPIEERKLLVENSCEPIEGSQRRERTRSCQWELGGGSNKCNIGQTQTDYDYQKCQITPECPTPTPTIEPSLTPTPEATPEPTQAPRRDEGVGYGNVPWSYHYEQPTCNGIFPSKPLLLGFKRTDSTTVHLSWWPSDRVDKYSVEFWYYGDSIHMGQPDIGNTTQFDIKGLKANKPINALIWAWNGQCVTKSTTIDP
jgi:hypothetical protein